MTIHHRSGGSGGSVGPVGPAGPSGSSVAIRARVAHGWGSSLMIAETNHEPVLSDRWMSKVCSTIGALEKNYALGGTAIINSGWTLAWPHVADGTHTSGTTMKNRPVRQLALLDHMFNDIRLFGADAGFNATYRECVRAWARMMRAGHAWRDNTAPMSYGGATWSHSGSYGGTQFAASPTAPAATFTTPTGSWGGTVTMYAMVQSNTNVTWRGRAKINGGAYVTTVDATAMGVSGQGSPVPIVVPGVPTGSGQTVTVDFDNLGAGSVYFLGATMESNFIPLTLILDCNYIPVMPHPVYTNFTVSAVNAGNAELATVVASFSDGFVAIVTRASLQTGSVGNTIYFQDDIHYNQRGDGTIADLVLAKILALGGIPQGFGGEMEQTTSGAPNWSGIPGTVVLDPAASKIWSPAPLGVSHVDGRQWLSSAALT